MTQPSIYHETRFIDCGDHMEPFAESWKLVTGNGGYSFREISSLANELFDNHPDLSLNLKETMACIRHNEGSEPDNAARLERYLARALEVLA